MKAVRITVDVPLKYVGATEDRDFLRVGQRLTGKVHLDSPGRPRSCRIRWLDSRGRLLGVTPGKLDRYQRAVAFEFELDQNLFWVHRIECDLDGVRQDAAATFFVSPETQGWETFPAITWGSYPHGDFYDRLKEVGVNGITAFKMNAYDHVFANAMRFYVDNCTPDEIATYHRPHKLFWEPPAGQRGPTTPWGNFRDNWRLIEQRYARVRDRLKKEGRMISRDDHYRKMLWRDFCPNDPGTLRVAGDRFQAVVRQHKGFRPLFQNMADEAGITDQTRPMDYCYCPFCMDKFRLELERKYGTLAELNRQWGTAFATWYEVYPLTCDETMDAQGRGRPWNFAAWADHRAFMDDTFAGFFGEVARLGRQVDPLGTFSQGGTQWPTCYGGWDYAKVVRTVDAIIPYNIGGNQEIIRSIRPELKNLSPFFGDHERQIRQMWYSFIHGDAGIIFWDADEPSGRFVVRPGGKLSRRGRLFGPAVREMRGGYAQQFKAWERTDEPIGLLYSQPSERAHWMLETIAERGKIEWFHRVYRGRYVNTRQSWQRLVEDRQMQYRYVSYLEVDEGKADLGRFRLLVLPECLALSETQVKALRQFVHDGGVLVADGRAGRMTENCRQVAPGLLDDLFGIVHGEELTLRPGAAVKPRAAGARPWLALDPHIRLFRALDASVRLASGAGAEAAAAAGPAPAVVRRKVGSGWAVYLNLDLNGYEDLRYQLKVPAAEAARKLLDGLVALAGIRPAVRVSERTLGTSAGIEVTRFRQRGGELAVALMNRMWRSSGVGEALPDAVQEAFETDRRVELEFGGPAHTYDSRSGRYLGWVDRVSRKLPRLTPLVVARLPYRVRKIEVAMPRRVAAGERVELGLAVRTDLRGGWPADHAIRVDVYAPDGAWAHWYSAVVVAADGVGRHVIPLALNDAAGAWRVEVRDTLTGTTATQTLRVGKAKRSERTRR